MKIFIAVLLAGTAISALTVPARADDGADMTLINACRAITSDLGRLSCYDGVVKQASTQTPQVQTPAPQGQATAPQTSPPSASPQPPRTSMGGNGTGNWLHNQSVDGLDKSAIETIILPATSANVGLLNKPGVKHGPALVIRCKERQTSVFVAFDLPVTGTSEAVPVQYRVGDTAPKAAIWSRAQDNEAFGFWDTPHAVALIQELTGHNELYVRATPPDRFQSDALFKLDGIDAALQPIRAACGW